MKKLLIIFVILLTGCSTDAIQKKEFVNLSHVQVYGEQKEIETFRVDGVTYIDFYRFFDIVKFIDPDIEIEDGILTDSVQHKYNMSRILDTNGVDYEVVFDFDNNTISFNDFGFVNNVGEAHIQDNENKLIDYTYRSGDPVVIDLDDYDMPFIERGKQFAPLAIMNELFMNDLSLYETNDALTLIRNMDFVFAYASPEVSFSSDFSLDKSKKYLEFYFDYVNGVYSIDDFNLNGINSSSYSGYMRDLDYQFTELEDFHTRIYSRGVKNYWMNLFELGNNISTKKTRFNRIDSTCNTQEVEVPDGIKYIQVNTFTEEVNFRPYDLIDTDIVVLDLRCNSGGQINHTDDALGYLLGEYSYGVLNPVSNEYSYYTFDYESVGIDVENIYVLTSEKTYSAGNIFTSVMKENGATILGSDTGGGACSVSSIIGLNGEFLKTSSTNCFTNSNEEVIEEGVEVDVEMEIDLEELFDSLLDK